MAITSVESYALRRAAIGLGDRLGLGLYNDGKLEPLVRGSLQLSDKDSPLYREPSEEEVTAKAASVDRLQAATNAR